ncbi:MAG: hypothetical protein RL072_1794 [Actinomycetota bacterium]|jgi:Flp pilus assembly protein TadB
MNRVILSAIRVRPIHRYFVRRRFGSPHRFVTPKISLVAVKRLKRRDTPSSGEVLAAALDNMARELRLGASLHAAIIATLERQPITTLHWLIEAAHRGDSLHELPSRQPAIDPEVSLMLRAIQAASEGGDPVHAMESAARTLRSTAAVLADSRSAVSHTKASINVLTWVPLVVVLWLMLQDESVRRFFVSPAGAICLTGGLGLNVLGRSLVQRATRRATMVTSEVPDFVDLVSIHLRSGKPPALAFLAAADASNGEIATAARMVMETQRDGRRFVEALSEHRATFSLGAQPLIDALIDTERYGLSSRELFERLSAEAHAQRRREADRNIRALPVRLTIPLVGCVLPAYVLLAVVPLLAGQLTSVDLGPHPLTEGTP